MIRPGRDRVIEAAEANGWNVQASRRGLNWLILQRRDRNKQLTTAYIEHSVLGVITYARWQRDYLRDVVTTGADKAGQVVCELGKEL